MNERLNRGDLRERLEATKQWVLQDAGVQQFIAKHREELTEDQIERSMSKLYEYVQEQHRIENGETPKFPHFYPQLFLNVNYIDIRYIPTPEFLEQQREVERRKRVNLVELPKSLRQASFRLFDTSDKRRQEALVKMLDFNQAFKAKPKQFHRAIYLSGPFGVGKTYLLAALANDLADAQTSVTLLHYPTFVTDMKNSIKQDNVSEKMQLLIQTPILMLDDIGAESNSAWIRDDVLGVMLQARMSEGLPTFFSSNFTMEQLEEHLSHTANGEEKIKAARIMERVRYLSEEIAMDGRNRRHE